MAEEFNEGRAADRHQAVMREVQRIRDGISHDVIDYYYNAPSSEAEEREKRAGMRKFLRIAAEQIDQLLVGRLN